MLFRSLLIDGKELEELKIGSKGKDKLYRDEMCRTANLIEEKGKHFAWQIFRWHLSFLLLKVDSLRLLWTAGSYGKMRK